jgi:hypothetical protein
VTQINSLAELEPARCRTIVINVNTDLVAARAILSAKAFSSDPLLVINCEPTDSGRATLARLMQTYEFDLLEAPLRLHGDCLDWLFTNLDDERLLLLDSDAEIRDPTLVARLHSKLDHEEAFGAGFIWGPFFIDEQWNAPPHAQMLYMERPWMPCVMFKRVPVAGAIGSGISFNAFWQPNEMTFWPRVSNFLGARWGPPWATRSRLFEKLPAGVQARMTKWQLNALRWSRRYYYGLQPHAVTYDTAGLIYDHLRFHKAMLFAGNPVELSVGEVHHYLGVTRHAMVGHLAMDTAQEDVAEEVIARLHSVYGFDWES